MKKYVLFEGEVWQLMRPDHFGDSELWYLSTTKPKMNWNRWVIAKNCTLLDPALNVLFERKEDD